MKFTKSVGHGCVRSNKITSRLGMASIKLKFPYFCLRYQDIPKMLFPGLLECLINLDCKESCWQNEMQSPGLIMIFHAICRRKRFRRHNYVPSGKNKVPTGFTLCPYALFSFLHSVSLTIKSFNTPFTRRTNRAFDERFLENVSQF